MTVDISTQLKSFALATGVVSFVAGMWTGVWIVPTRALDVPTSTEFVNGQMKYSAAYQPVPTWLPVVSVLLVLAGLYAAWRISQFGDDSLELDDIDRIAAELKKAPEVEDDD